MHACDWYTSHSLVLNRTCQVPSAKLRLMARWKGELTGFQNRYRWLRESTRSTNASRFNPGTASKNDSVQCVTHKWTPYDPCRCSGVLCVYWRSIPASGHM